MKNIAWSIQGLWGLSISAQFFLCVLLFYKRNSRKLPLFTGYIILNLSQAVTLFIAYKRFGFDSHIAFLLGWTSHAASTVVRAFAIIEVCRFALSGYPGVWKLIRHASSIVFAVVTLIGAIGAIAQVSKDPGWALGIADLGVNLAIVLSSIIYLVISRHYFIYAGRPYVDLIWGFSFYCWGVSLAESIFKPILFTHFAFYQAQAVWQAIMLLSYIYVLILWIRALHNPLPPIPSPIPLRVRPPVPQTERVRYELRGFAAIFARMVLPETQ